MVTTKIEALAAAKARVAKLEKSIASELNRELAGLPARFGFSDIKSFVGAVKAAASGKRGRRRGRPAKAVAPVKRRKRAKITDATRAEVKNPSANTTRMKPGISCSGLYSDGITWYQMKICTSSGILRNSSTQRCPGARATAKGRCAACQ